MFDELDVRFRGAETWRVEFGCRELEAEESVLDSEALEPRRARESCCEIMDMEDWLRGLEKEGKEGEGSPEPFVARREGLAPGWREELRRGEPTWPKVEWEPVLWALSCCCCTNREL